MFLPGTGAERARTSPVVGADHPRKRADIPLAAGYEIRGVQDRPPLSD